MKKNIPIALTFDDVLLKPLYSNVLPKEVDLSTRLSNNIQLNVPFISAAMDTVTESEMAIALAREGGMGVIHKNLTIEQQALEVDKVKRSESGMILDPITISSSKSIKDALIMMSRYKISGVPVIDKDKLVGILTNRDIRFEENLSLKVSDRMTSSNLVTVPVGTTLDEAKKVLQKHRIEKLLVIDTSGSLKGLITVKDIQKKEKFPNASKDMHGRLIVAAAVGTDANFLERAAGLIEKNVDALVVDTAHGHSQGVLDVVNKLKAKFSNIDIIAGNVATAEGTQALIDNGADIIKVGIGAGSSCTTRIIAGVGVPQLTSVKECSQVAKQNNKKIISDGGMRFSGDIAKSFAVGADAVMLGGMFAGTDESPGEIVIWEGRSYKKYRGMGSVAAMREGSSDRYFQNLDESKKLVPEGVEGLVPYKGHISENVHQLAGGIKSCLGYCGSKNIKEFHEKAEFVQITSSGMVESHPHDINITKDSPNYRKIQLK